MGNGKGYFQAFGLGFPNGEGEPPKLTLKGEHSLADTIVSLAKRYGVPVVERPSLCEALADVPLDSEIPPELYEIAAALLVELEALEQRLR